MKKPIERLYEIIATGFGTGYAPKAPGTVGSLLACLLYVLLVGSFGWQLTAEETGLFTSSFSILFFLFILFSFFIGLPSSRYMEQKLGKDPSCVVIDEIAGMWIALWAIPFTWTNLLLAFILFRFFDILKPMGIGYFDKNLKGEWGIMMDDVLAGVYANIVLRLIVEMVGMV